MSSCAPATGRVRVGLEVLLDTRRDLLAGRRVALLAHASAVTPALVHAADALSALPGLRLVRLFGPEHGLRGEAQDMVAVDGGQRDEATGAEVVSLYGCSADSLRPPPGSLDDVDVLVCDIQDVGTRFYTYAATLARCMEAAAAAGVAVVVCDRPNPIGGLAVEGGCRIEPGYASFVGEFPVPIRHGLTIGELAVLHRERADLDVELHVVRMAGWSRQLSFGQTGLPWVLPSPNMPTVDTALVYPGMCLIEGTNLSEGRGTTRPFELVGAPFLRGRELARRLDGLALPGVAFRACGFTPTFQKHAGRSCGGVQLHVTDPERFLPVLTGVAVLLAARQLAPADFAWRREAYEFVAHHPAIDLLAGSPRLRLGIDAGASLAELQQLWLAEDERFREERNKWLLYA